MFMSVVVVTILGTIASDGIQSIFDKASQGDRLTLFKYVFRRTSHNHSNPHFMITSKNFYFYLFILLLLSLIFVHYIHTVSIRQCMNATPFGVFWLVASHIGRHSIRLIKRWCSVICRYRIWRKRDSKQTIRWPFCSVIVLKMYAIRWWPFIGIVYILGQYSFLLWALSSLYRCVVLLVF